MQQLLSRVWFLNQGCKQVPLDYTRGIVRWAHPDGYFLNAQGQKVAHTFSPSQLKITKDPMRKTGKLYPCMTGGLPHIACHVLMALTFYGDRPMDPSTGKVRVCHHLIPDALDYRPANLLCWLTRAEHAEADRRQRALRAVLPDMHAISYEKHRFLQDPRTTCREVFDLELQKLRQQFNSLTI